MIKKLQELFLSIFLLGILAVYLYPIYWIVSTSLRSPLEIIAGTGGFLFTPTLDNYIHIFRDLGFSSYIVNSLIIAVFSTLLSLVVGSIAAYSFVRFTYPKNLGYHLPFYILSTRMLPPAAVILPIFFLMRFLGVLDRHISLIIAYTVFNLPFVVWLMKGFFKDIPREIEEAAMISGYTRLGAFVKVILPLVKPGLLTSAILCFIFSWNEFFFALILTGRTARTLPVALQTFMKDIGILWGPLTATSVIIILPVFIFALLIRRYMVRGLTFGAVRE